jgi:hypothetical protein
MCLIITSSRYLQNRDVDSKKHPFDKVGMRVSPSGMRYWTQREKSMTCQTSASGCTIALSMGLPMRPNPGSNRAQAGAGEDKSLWVRSSYLTKPSAWRTFLCTSIQRIDSEGIVV